MKRRSKVWQIPQICLVFIMVFSSLAPVFSMPGFALEEHIDEPLIMETDVITEGNQPLKDEIIVQEEEATAPREEEELITMDPPSAPYIDRNERKEPLEGLNIDADNNTGALIYNFSIQIPAGRNNLTPNLNLSYNNQEDDYINQFGHGWSINIPSITRVNKHGSDTLYTENYFNSSLSGDLKLATSTDGIHGEYVPEVDNGDFFKYEFTDNNYWQVTDKQGVVNIFGYTATSRQDNPNNSSQIYKWMLNETRDTNDNYIKYEYYKDAGQIYPDIITYTGYDNTDGIFTLEFIRETRNDNLKSNYFGFELDNNYRIKEIEVKINDQWIKKYIISYTNGYNGSNSYLDTILEQGKDETGATVDLPINDFDYIAQDKDIVYDENYSFPVNFQWGSEDEGVRLGEVNGDGLMDIIRAKESQTPYVYINNGYGWDWDQNWIFPTSFIWSGLDSGVRLVDIDGDGRDDIVQGISTSRQVWLNNGSGWATTTSWTFPTDFSDGNHDLGTRMADVNGDGLVDVIRAGGHPDEPRYIWLNNGSGWSLDESWDFPTTFLWGDDNGVRLAEVNGDGLIDIIRGQFVYPGDPIMEVYINNGSGWLLDESWDLPVTFVWGSLDQGARLMDINGDNLVDIVVAKDGNQEPIHEVYINNGLGWNIDNNYSLPTTFIYSNGVSKGTYPLDSNGDGVPELVTADWNEQNNRYVYVNEGSQELLSQINTGQGSQIDITYKPSTKYKDSSDELLNPSLPIMVQTVEQINIDDGLGNNSTINYKYKDGSYYYGDAYKRKFASFGQVEKTIDDVKTITYYHQGNESNSNQGEYQDSYYKIGKPYRKEVYDNSTNTLLNQEVYKWEEYDLGNDNKFVYNTQKSSTDFTNTTKSTAIQYQYSTSTGNLLTENNLGEVVVNVNTGEITNQLTGDEKDTNYQYAYNETDHILAAPKNKTISDSSGSKAEDLYYDNLPLGEVDKVNLTKEDYEEEAEINRNFNNYGLVYQEITPEKATTTIAYDAFNLYPYTTTNDLNQTTYTEYNLFNGQVATSTAPSGQVTVNKYDAFGRLKEVKISDPESPASFTIKQEISYNDSSSPRYSETKNYFDISSYASSREYYDGLDRVVQKKTSLASGNEFSTVDILYDSQGRVSQQSLPYITASISYSSPNLSQPAKTYTYDALDRVLTESTPTGVTSYEYDGWTTTITDANGHQKDLTKDAYGNLVEVKEYNDNDDYTTSYDYTLTSKLEKITDSEGNIRNFHYDALDNLDWQDMVHTPSTPTPAKIQYTHDKNGNVLTETSFKGDQISYEYDDLNRVLYEKLNNSPVISYTYDQNDDIGQLSFVDYGGGNSKAYDYDILGRLTTATTTIENEAFVMKYDYNLNGDLSAIEYPDGKIVAYGFNGVGQVDEVNLDQGQGFATVVNNVEYNQNGQMTHLERENGIITNYEYPANQSFRLDRIYSNIATTTLQNINYSYDNVGNITYMVDWSKGVLDRQITYNYDDLYRLTTSTVAYTNHSQDNYTQTFSYDPIGNMSSNSDLGTLNYANSNPHQLSGYGIRSFQYDTAGNMTRNGGINKFSWDWRSRLSVSNDIASNNNTYYKYDHNNQRFLKYTEDYIFIPDDPNDPGGGDVMGGDMLQGEGLDGALLGHWEWRRIKEDKYVDNYFEKNLADHTKSHIFLNSTKVATINDNNSPYYILSDHLGSSSILTDSSGNIAEQIDYTPYGTKAYESIVTNLSNDYDFTGKETDEENSLQYYGARYMDNEIGRFVSVDPILLNINQRAIKTKLADKLSQDPLFQVLVTNLAHNQRINGNTTDKEMFNTFLSDPQSLNSYSYSINNPVVYIDPDGNDEYHIGVYANVSIGAWNISVDYKAGYVTEGALYDAGSFNWGGETEAVGTGLGVSAGQSNANSEADIENTNLSVSTNIDSPIKLFQGGTSLNFEEGKTEPSGFDIYGGMGWSAARFSVGAQKENTEVLNYVSTRDIKDVAKHAWNRVNSWFNRDDDE